MPELGPYGSVRGARGNSRPYRESRPGLVKPTQKTPSRTWGDDGRMSAVGVKVIAAVGVGA